MSVHPAHQIWTLKVMQRNFMNCMGIFQMPMFVIAAVYIPTWHEPSLIWEKHRLWHNKYFGYSFLKPSVIPVSSVSVLRNEFLHSWNFVRAQLSEFCCCVSWGFWRPSRNKDFLVVACNWHQHHPIFLQLLFFCPMLIMSVQNFSTIQCTVLLFSNLMHNFLLKYQ